MKFMKYDWKKEVITTIETIIVIIEYRILIFIPFFDTKIDKHGLRLKAEYYNIYHYIGSAFVNKFRLRSLITRLTKNNIIIIGFFFIVPK